VGAGASFLTVEFAADDSNPLDGAPLLNSQESDSCVKSGSVGSGVQTVLYPDAGRLVE